jgi:hypothetical protein
MKNSNSGKCRKLTASSPRSFVPPALGLGLAVAFCAWAADYSIDWYTIDGGGGTSTGGVYSLSGTIGQPDAGFMSGGNYTLQGGFWGIVAAIQTPGAPWLTISNAQANVVVSWQMPATGFLLEQTAVLGSPSSVWTTVPFPYQTNLSANTISVDFTAGPGNKFLRLRQP